MSISKRNFRKAAKEALEKSHDLHRIVTEEPNQVAKMYDYFLNQFRKIIYELLSTRDDKDKVLDLYHKCYQNHEEAYYKWIETLTRRYGFEPDNYWLVIHLPSSTQWTIKDNVKENHKEYFTFKPRQRIDEEHAEKLFGEVEETLEAIQEFVADLEHLYEELSKINNNERIVFKIPSTLRRMLFLSDNLVVYYKDKSLSKEVRETVKHAMKGKKYVLVRERRAGHGHDFWNMLTDEGLSHGDVVAQLVSYALIQESAKRKFADEGEIEDFIKKTIADREQWTVEQTRHELRGHPVFEGRKAS